MRFFIILAFITNSAFAMQAVSSDECQNTDAVAEELSWYLLTYGCECTKTEKEDKNIFQCKCDK